MHVFNDVSTTAAAVTSSSAEAFAALCLPPGDHDELMCFTSSSPGPTETPFYKRYANRLFCFFRFHLSSNSRLNCIRR